MSIAHEGCPAANPLLGNSPEKCFLHALFSELNASGTRYAVLRNYQNLPDSVGGSDLDILVHPDDGDLMRAVISKAVKSANGGAIGWSETPGFFKVFALGLCDGTGTGWWGLCLDIALGLQFSRAAALVDNEILESRFQLFGAIRVLPDHLAAVLGVVKELLYNNVLSARYLDLSAEAARTNWEPLRTDLAPMGGAALDLLRDLCLQSPDAPDIAAKSEALRNTVLKTAFSRAPFAYLKSRFLHEWSKVQRYFSPPGVVVAVLGTDGAGKSTIIAAIEPALMAATHGAFAVNHLRPGFLPALARLKGKAVQQDGPMTDPHGSKPSGTIGSLFRVTYLLADYIFGYWLKVRPKIAKSPTVVLFDRYAYDMALDPRRFRIGLAGNVVAWLIKLAPKPDLIICLHGDPAIIVERKNELPLAEVTRQTQALIAFAHQEPRAVLVSTEGTINQARDQVLNALLEFCERKAKGDSLRAA